MKKFIEYYIVPPVLFLLFVLVLPSVVLGGATFAFHLAGYLPNMGICQKAER